jgi:energy-coupling factor transport system ATP-binding protein
LPAAPVNPAVEDFAFSFDHFSFRYRAQTAPTLVDINLCVRRGEKIVILGPSGSGKSTLMHCLNGLIPQVFRGEMSGGLTLLGEDIRQFDVFAISKKAGTVLQDTDGQFVGLSAAEDIAFALENSRVPADLMRGRVLEAASLVGMTDHLDKSPHDLSGGQKQRISLAGVLIDNVDILLFDEPLANLDPAAGRDAIELIDAIHQKTGKTIIIVEHRLEDVLHCPVDRIVLMREGRIAADMAPAELLSSNLLKGAGIREPLYVSALAFAGIRVDAASAPQSLRTLRVDYAPLREWDSRLAGAVPPDSGKTAPTAELLSVENLRFRYTEKGEEALKGVSFTISRGECVSLVGKNGSGKSTLAKCVCGFARPDSGSIRYEGRDLAELSITERAEKIGYVMQNPNQMISFPLIYDEAAFGPRNRGIGETEIREQVHEALRICGLYPFRNWPVSALSYGQKKRLTIASILVLRPSLMILDEPTAGQDYRHYTEFMEFLGSLNRELGLSLLLITHDMHLMLEYSDRAVVLAEGSRIACAEPFEVLTDDAVIERASLKRTSLYDLALAAGLADPKAFVSRYIAFEKQQRPYKKEEAK